MALFSSVLNPVSGNSGNGGRALSLSAAGATDGDDTLSGGNGNDTLYGALGNDWIDGGSGKDNLYGEAGDDTLLGGAGKDTLYGGSGSDSLNGGSSNDKLFGEGGDDTLLGESGNDTLEGGRGDDVLFSGSGKDKLLGGEGDDTLVSQSGNNDLTGDEGNDVFIIEQRTGSKTMVNDFDPENDKIDLTQIPGLYALGDLIINETSAGLEIDLGDGQVLILKGLEPGDLLPSGFLFAPSPFNEAPDAKASAIATVAGQALEGMLTATDPNAGDGLTFSLAALGEPQHGALALNGDGSFTYTPDTAFIGKDSFTFEVTDQGGLTDTATVDITVGLDGKPFLLSKSGNGVLDFFPVVSGLENGGFVASWFHRVVSADPALRVTNVEGRTFDAYGLVSVDTFELFSDHIGGVNQMDIAALPGNAFVGAQTTFGSTPGSLVSQRFGADASKDGSLANLAVATDNIALTGLADGGYAAIWENESGGRFPAVSMKIVEPNGAATNIFVDSSSGSSVRRPDIAELNDGRIVVVYDDRNLAGDTGLVAAQIFDANGSVSTSAFRVNVTTPSSQGDASVAALADGGFVVFWNDQSPAGDADAIRGRIYNADGTVQTGEITAISDQERPFSPKVAGLEDGGFAVTWATSDVFPGTTSPANVKIHAQVYNDDGTERGSEFIVKSLSGVTNFSAIPVPEIAGLEEGGFVITFHLQEVDANNGTVLVSYGALFDSEGRSVGLNASSGEGNDTFAGGMGVDRFVFGAGNGDDIVRNFTPGEDRLAFLVSGTLATSAVDADNDGATDDVRVDLAGIGGGSVALIDVALTDLSGGDFVFIA